MPTPIGGGPPHTVPGSRLQVSEKWVHGAVGAFLLDGVEPSSLTEERGHVGPGPGRDGLT